MMGIRSGAILFTSLVVVGISVQAQELRIKDKVGLACHQVVGIGSTSGSPPPSVQLNHHFGSGTYPVGQNISWFCSVAGPSQSAQKADTGLTCYPVKANPRTGGVVTASAVQKAELKVQQMRLWCLPSHINK